MSDVYTLARLQKEVREWSEANFGTQPSWRPLLGAMEELGELAHAHLKHSQQIRGYTEETAKLAKLDAIGDVVIYLTDYCNREGLDLEFAIYATWLGVKNRNWKNNPLQGVQNVPSPQGSENIVP